MNDTNTPVWLTPATLKLRDEARTLKTDLADAQGKAQALLNVDGDTEKTVEKLATIRARQEVISAKLQRCKASLKASLIEDAKAEAAAAKTALDEAMAVLRAIRVDWRTETGFTKCSAAREMLRTNRAMWPRELTAAEESVRQARERNSKTNGVLCSIDWDTLRPLQGSAAPSSGHRTDAADCYRAACQIMPELG
jgi:hypothetical protein